MKIKALQNTFLKRTVQDSSLLSDKEKVLLNKDQILEVSWVHDSNNHYQIALHNPLKGFFNWYVFKQHVQINGSKKLTEEDYQKAATTVGLSVSHIKAVVEVEASGSGFLPSGKAKILCEGQWFSEFTNSRYDKTHPQISYLKWDKSKYYGGEKEWQRFDIMYRLDSNAAIKATSWGLFQIMGFHYAVCGYSSPFEYYQAMQESEAKQLDAFLKFINSKGLVKYLKNKDWDSFAYRYNGEGYKANRYDDKLEKAFEKYSKQ